MRALVLFTLAVAAQSATADWVVNGVSFACWRQPESFQLAPVAKASYPEAELPLLPGFRELPYGKHTLKCKVGKSVVATTLRVYPPAERGQGMGQGYVEIASLKVGDFPYIERPTPFDWSLYDDPSLTRIRVYVKGSETFVEACHTRAGDGGPIVKCEATLAEAALPSRPSGPPAAAAELIR